MNNLMIVCDDAARMVDSKSQSSGMINLIRIIRSAGITLDLNVQSSDVMPEILSNTALKYIGPCGSATDYNTIGAAMGLTHEERPWLNTNLLAGTFVALLNESPWRKPFVVRIPYLHLEKSTSDDEIQRQEDLKELFSLPTVVAEEFNDWPSVESHSNKNSSVTDTETNESGLSDAEIRFIKTVIKNPNSPSSYLCKFAHVSPRKGQEIRRRLVDQGYFREHFVSTGRRGRAAVILEPLEPALKVIRDIEEKTS